MAIGSMHRKCRKDRVCGSGDILVDRQTHRQMGSSQHFATALAGEVATAGVIENAQMCYSVSQL